MQGKKPVVSDTAKLNITNFGNQNDENRTVGIGNESHDDEKWRVTSSSAMYLDGYEVPVQKEEISKAAEISDTSQMYLTLCDAGSEDQIIELLESPSSRGASSPSTMYLDDG